MTQGCRQDQECAALSAPGREEQGRRASRGRSGGGGDDAVDHGASTEASSPIPPLDPRLAAAGESDSRLLVSSFFTLTLAILGSSVLPVPFAWSRAGLFPGLLIMLVVAAANACACRLLMSAAEETGHDTYDGVAGEAGGEKLKLVTQASLVLLLFGTVCGDIALLAEVAPRSLSRLFPAGAAPNSASAAVLPPLLLFETLQQQRHNRNSYSHLHQHHQQHRGLALPGGRLCAFLLTLFVVTPLCFLRRMRSLEAAAAGGVAVVVALMASVVSSAVISGAPAIVSGEFPIWRPVSAAALPEAAAVLGFAFYLAPVLFPLLHELPPSPRGPRLAARASRGVTALVAPLVYGALGIAGAARHGKSTAGSLLANEWLGGGRADGVLDAAAVAYLSISIPPMQHSLRYTLETMVAGEDAPACDRRRMLLTAGPLAAALAVALAAPQGAEKIFAVTGAIPVCAVCYVLPAFIHLSLLFKPGGRGRDLVRGGGVTRWRRRNGEDGVEDPSSTTNSERPLLGGNGNNNSSSRPRRGYFSSSVIRWWELAADVLLPVGMALLGVATSLAAGWLALAALLGGGGEG